MVLYFIQSKNLLNGLADSITEINRNHLQKMDHLGDTKKNGVLSIGIMEPFRQTPSKILSCPNSGTVAAT